MNAFLHFTHLLFHTWFMGLLLSHMHTNSQHRQAGIREDVCTQGNVRSSCRDKIKSGDASSLCAAVVMKNNVYDHGLMPGLNRPPRPQSGWSDHMKIIKGC